MDYIFLIIIVLVIYSFYSVRNKRKQKEKLVEYFKNQWNIPKKGEYFNFDKISAYFNNNSHKEKSFHIIDEQEKIDLDIDEIFKFLDRTSSKIGQQYLYYKLRTIRSLEKLKDFNSLNKLFLNNSEIRIKTQILLSSLNNYDAYELEKLINDITIEKPIYIKYLLPLSIAALLFLFLGFYNPIFFLLLLPIFSVNLIFHFKNKDNINYYISAVNELKKSLNVAKKCFAINELNSFFKKADFINEIEIIKFKTNFIGFEKQLNGEFAVLFWYIIEIFKIQFNIETIIFYSFIDDIIKKNKSIDELFCFIGKIDTAISVASIKSGNLKTCEPNFNMDNKISIKEISHPLINECITNSIELKSKSLLLTGSNMSGKTTFIRSIALNTILSQTLYIAFAKEFSIPFFKIYSSIRISDNLLDDTSYFLKEVLIIKELIKASDNQYPCLFVLDEIFKGTNTIERISGGKSILSYLNKEKHFILVSTHDIELTDLLKNENFELYHFCEKVENGELKFDHKLKKGKLKTRNAIKILELYDYPSKIIEDSKSTEKTLANNL
jgi:hypothetical protein